MILLGVLVIMGEVILIMVLVEEVELMVMVEKIVL